MKRGFFLQTGAFAAADPSVKALLKGNYGTGNIKCKITLYMGYVTSVWHTVLKALVYMYWPSTVSGSAFFCTTPTRLEVDMYLCVFPRFVHGISTKKLSFALEPSRCCV